MIVMAMIAIIAVIAIPRFVNATEEAAESALAKDLQMVRRQIELFKLHHGGILPGQDDIEMVQQLTGRTDADGTLNAGGAFGPYMRVFPTNPFTESNDVRQAGGSSPGVGDQAWFYNHTTGLFAPNDDAHKDL